jgi:hypothetical protein
MAIGRQKVALPRQLRIRSYSVRDIIAKIIIRAATFVDAARFFCFETFCLSRLCINKYLALCHFPFFDTLRKIFCSKWKNCGKKWEKVGKSDNLAF